MNRHQDELLLKARAIELVRDEHERQVKTRVRLAFVLGVISATAVAAVVGTLLHHPLWH